MLITAAHPGAAGLEKALVGMRARHGGVCVLFVMRFGDGELCKRARGVWNKVGDRCYYEVLVVYVCLIYN